MRPQHPCCTLLRRIHHAADGGNHPARILHAGGHGRRQERRNALLIQFPCHLANRVLALHRVMPAEGVDVRIDKPRQDKIPLQVYHSFAIQRR